MGLRYTNKPSPPDAHFHLHLLLLAQITFRPPPPPSPPNAKKIGDRHPLILTIAPTSPKLPK